MKILIATLLSLTLTILSFPQEEDNNVQFGLGVSLSSELSSLRVFSEFGEVQILTQPLNLANFSMIIKGNFFRFEPSLGYFTISSDYSNDGYTYERSSSNIRLGAVLAFNNDPIESVDFYYGIDFGVIISSYSFTSNVSDQSTDDSKTDFFIGPAVGGEYMFNKHFSLGGEINLNYISIGHYDSEGESSSWAISTRGLIFLRWYIN
jgi:hypothetical protein